MTEIRAASDVDPEALRRHVIEAWGAEAVVAHLLEAFGLIDERLGQALGPVLHPPILNRAGRSVGAVRVNDG